MLAVNIGLLNNVPFFMYSQYLIIRIIILLAYKIHLNTRTHTYECVTGNFHENNFNIQ